MRGGDRFGNSPCTVHPNDNACWRAQRYEMLRGKLAELVGVGDKHRDMHHLPIEEWDNDRVRRILEDGSTVTVPQHEVDATAHSYFVRLVSVARDSKGNLVVADPLHHCVRRLSSDGSEHIVAGSGHEDKGGFADGNGADALFLCPSGIAIDKEDNMYISDFYNNRIRKVTCDGVVSTIAGTGDAGHRDGHATHAMLDHPESIALDVHGNLFVADWGNHRIRKICLTEEVYPPRTHPQKKTHRPKTQRTLFNLTK